MSVLMSSMAVISSATVTVTVSGAAVLEYENPYKVDEETQDGDHKQPLMFHLERIDMLVTQYTWAFPQLCNTICETQHV